MRAVLVLAHTGRRDAVEAAVTVAENLHAAGLRPVMLEHNLQSLAAAAEQRLKAANIAVAGREVEIQDCEIGMVLGGDGSILRAADRVRDARLPLMGINLGHVGFLAESERTQIDDSVQWVIDQNYTVEERMALDVQVWQADQHLGSSWALNEASIEKASRQRMVELVIEIDGAPVSAFGCDGIVMSTPTGSTAYAFSAGGPVVWPEVQALVLVPISAHALFARPLVVAPDSVMAVELLQREDERGILWCDGSRSMELPPGARVEVTRSEKSVLLARVHQTPFSQRLVDKFNLPTTGWRGPVEAHNTLPSREPEIGLGPDPEAGLGAG
ncbi:NAD kinase [Nesterenkonia sp. MY13]|uniref:NAD kinase n=1 Tax=Nesterenkonia sedimenti TaxID=1463632 RepID=A0A7X8TH10_9MICC|nr:NAD kinase [Nesterenkonia sedimenti]NLS08419.1 NAD kinase [Nesterenkonia sedimenti]